jgi:cytochrome c6
MRILRLLVFLAFLAIGAGYVWSSVGAVPQETSAEKAALSSEELARAKVLFRGKCARCHGPDGRGQTVLGKMLGAPNFTNAKWWKDHDNDDDFRDSIRRGNGDMPAFGKKLTKPEISLLADYVRHLNKSAHRERSTAPGTKVRTSPEP